MQSGNTTICWTNHLKCGPTAKDVQGGKDTGRSPMVGPKMPSVLAKDTELDSNTLRGSF